MNENKPRSVTLPGAVIIAAAMIAIAIIWIHKPTSSPASVSTTATVPQSQGTIAPLSSSDHVFGNPQAPVKLIEYSDPSCPYCKEFNPTMIQIMSQYGPTGQVAWVYRQFPLYKPDADGNILHPNAGHQAEAFECAAALGGNAVFWKYQNEWFSVFPEDGADRTAAVDNQQIATVAQDVGLDAVSFNECLSSGRFTATIDQDYTAGINAGVTGTPYTVVVTPSGSDIPRPGAETYADLKTIIDTLLSSVSATSTPSK